MKRVTVNSIHPADAPIRAAAWELSRSGVVAYPTDTLYALGVDPRDPEAVARLYRGKARSARLAVPLIATDLEQVEVCAAGLSSLARHLAMYFWPGPLSLVLDGAVTLDRRILGDGGSVAVRVPDHPVATALARAFGHPITSTSANRSGFQAATDAESVAATVGDWVELILDGGQTVGGAPSTIVDARDNLPVLVREGAVPWERVLQSLA